MCGCEEYVIMSILFFPVLHQTGQRKQMELAIKCYYVWAMYYRMCSLINMETLLICKQCYLNFRPIHTPTHTNTKLVIFCTLSHNSVIHCGLHCSHDRLFLIGGLVWLVLSFGASVMRIFSLQILGDNTYIEWLTLQNLSNVTNPSQWAGVISHIHLAIVDRLRD